MVFWEILEPQIMCLLIPRNILLGIPLKKGCIQSSRIQLAFHSEKLPRPLNGLFLAIVTEAPISQHFKECVMINILSNIVQIVVFSTGTNAFLSVGRAF